MIYNYPWMLSTESRTTTTSDVPAELLKKYSSSKPLRRPGVTTMADLNFSDATIAALNKAKADHEAVATAEQSAASANDTLKQATDSASQAQQSVTDATNKSLESYRAALVAFATELGQQAPAQLTAFKSMFSKVS